MDYDPIKDRLGALASRGPLLHRAFFRALDTLFLRAWYVHRTTRALLARMPQQTVRVLDAGTGFGQHAYWLLREDSRVQVTAVDVKQDYLDAASRFFEQLGITNRITFRLQDLTQPTEEEDAYDLVLSVDVMEHIEDDRSVFRNVAQVLRPGGYFVVNTPSDAGGSDIKAEGESFIGEHVRPGYNPDELQEKLEEAGLEVTEWTYTYGRFGAAGWRLLIKHPIRLINRSWLFAPLLAPYYLFAAPAGLALNALDVAAEKATGTGLLMVARKANHVT